MDLLFFLIGFPFLAAILMLLIPWHRARGIVVKIAAAVIIVASVWLLAGWFSRGTVFFTVESEPASQAMFVIELLIALFILYLGIKYRNIPAIILILVQSGLMIYKEAYFVPALPPEHNLFLDQFSLIMAMIIGVIGSLICVYAVSYMDELHRHQKEVPDRRNIFFFIMFVFLSAMFGLVFSNNLVWLFFFWEITTLTSFLLIGSTGTKEAVKNSFLALNMNLIGGIAFAGALLYLASTGGVFELDQLLSSGAAIVLIPASLIGFAGIAKAAQMPFSSWLVGAMVAPTPVSALLHSSTMVKAGVYAIVRFAPVYQGTLPGTLIALVGGFTFLLASCIAISQSNAKKVLAYSTIANLGLIVACAGIGTYEAVWAAILLIIFHAIAKSLLFLGVGTIEHKIESRDIEDMGGLIVRMPKIAVMMLIGIAGMFLAPFGMLISKWAAIRAFINVPSGLVFIAILAFGGAVTVFFWAKWLGKIISVTRWKEVIKEKIGPEELTALYTLAGLTILVTLLFPLISSTLIEPYVAAIYGQTARLAQENIIIMLIMLFLLLILPISLLYYRRDMRRLTPYMAGLTTTSHMQYASPLGVQHDVQLANYYMENYFGERLMMRIGIPLTALLLVAMFSTVLVVTV